MNAFRKATKKKQSINNRIPKFELEDWEDYYIYYVHILEISESIFWNADISSLFKIVENKSAYDGYISYIRQKEYDKIKSRR